MSETEEKYHGLQNEDPGLPLRELAGNETIITWHDPEKEKPEDYQAKILILDIGKSLPHEVWRKGCRVGDYWWESLDGDITECPLDGKVLLWGSFDLPELPEVKE